MAHTTTNTQAINDPALVRAAVDAYLATPESFPVITTPPMQLRLHQAWKSAERRRYAAEPEPITGFGELAP